MDAIVTDSGLEWHQSQKMHIAPEDDLQMLKRLLAHMESLNGVVLSFCQKGAATIPSWLKMGRLGSPLVERCGRLVD